MRLLPDDVLLVVDVQQDFLPGGALAASGTTLADEMAWRSECAHGWWAMVRPPPPGLPLRPSVPLPDLSRPFWANRCAPHCEAPE